MKKLFFLFTVSILSIISLAPYPVSAQTNSDAELAAKIKAKIKSVGVDRAVSVRLQNKKKLTGNIVRINSDDFIISETESGKEQTVSYMDVTKAKQLNNRGVSTGVKAGIVVVGVLVILSLIGNGFGG